MKLKEKIENLIEKIVEKEGYQLKKVEIKKKGRVLEIIVTIDKKEGVSIEDCVKVSKLIDPLLEKENLFKKGWYLIVSSPGAEITKEELENL